MILLRLFKFSIAFLLLFAALSTATMAQEVEQQAVSENIEDSENPEESRSQRLKEYKERANERASEAKLNRVANRCAAAQRVITNIQNADRSKIDTRIAAHERVINAVERATLALTEAGVDTTSLQQVTAQLQASSDQVVSGLLAYLTTLEDIAAIDCEADTESFQAGLSIAREARKDLKDIAASFREYVKSDVKSALQEAKSELTSQTE